MAVRLGALFNWWLVGGLMLACYQLPMVQAPKHAVPERERTDRSLGAERRKTDDELVRHAAMLEENADAVVARARQRADEVLDRNRTRADDKLDQAGATLGERALFRDERRREDELVARERATADGELSNEREARRRALAAVRRVRA